MKFSKLLSLVLVPMLFSSAASAGVDTETAYVMNTFVMLMCGALIVWMAAGFCMLESGLVSSRSVAVICLKNVMIFSLSCVCFYIFGYNLMFKDLSSYSLFADIASSELSLMGGSESALPEVLKIDGTSSTSGQIFFQMTFIAAAASVISGALAERVKLLAFFIVVILLTSILYPIQGAWTWGGGWLAKMGFSDFAGSTIVHSVGGWTALTGVYFLGPRRGKYRDNGEVRTYFPHSVPITSLGVFILWFGWLGFNGGSMLVVSGAADISKMALIFMNTNLAACAGAIVALIAGKIVYGRPNILLILNGGLAGLVAITAGPDSVAPYEAMIIGSIGSILATVAVPILDKFRLDDVVGAIPVHLVAGIWGTLAVGIWGPGSFVTQLIGVASIGAFLLVTSAIIWYVLKKTIGIRVSEDVEDLGQDLLELGIETNVDELRIGNFAD